MDIKWARSARKHRIGRAHAAYVIETAPSAFEPSPAPHLQPRLRWVGADDRGVELEVVAVVTDVLLVIHVMPTALRRK